MLKTAKNKFTDKTFANLLESWRKLSKDTFDQNRNDIFRILCESGVFFGVTHHPEELRVTLYLEDKVDITFVSEYTIGFKDLLTKALVTFFACSRKIKENATWVHAKSEGMYTTVGCVSHAVIKKNMTNGGYNITPSLSSFPEFILEEDLDVSVRFNLRKQEYYSSTDYGPLVFYVGDSGRWACRKEVFLGLNEENEIRFVLQPKEPTSLDLFIALAKAALKEDAAS